jgi:uncharacterized protein YgiM (DUF1202 family)
MSVVYFYSLLVRRTRMRFLLPLSAFFIISLAVSAFVFAQDTSYEGVVTGDNVNLRADAGKQHKSLMQMKKDAKVTVVGKKEVAGETWLEVEVPSDVFLYISKRYVQKKDEKGQVIGVVKTEDPGGKVAVRTGTATDDEILGYVQNGETVEIRGAQDEWYNIVPPKGVHAWLRSDYVKKVGAETPPATGEAALTRRLEEIEKQIKILTEEANELRKKQEEQDKERKERERAIERIEEIERAYKELVEEANRGHQARMEQIGKGEMQRRRYVAEGIVDDFGKLAKNPPASYRLRVSENGDTKCYLESVDPSVDLRHYLKKRVGVNGEIEKRKLGDEEIKVIKVDSIAILED